MSNGGTFRDGFVEGWKAIRGSGSAVPASTTYAASNGRTSFQEGIRRAVLKALEAEGRLSNQDTTKTEERLTLGLDATEMRNLIK